MAKHRAHSVEFKRQVVQEYLAGETFHSLSKRHDISRNLIRVWIQKYKAGAFDKDAVTVDMIQEYEARITALERLVGKQALELEFLKGALRNAPRLKSGPTSVIIGPAVSPSASRKDASGLPKSLHGRWDDGLIKPPPVKHTSNKKCNCNAKCVGHWPLIEDERGHFFLCRAISALMALGCRAQIS